MRVARTIRNGVTALETLLLTVIAISTAATWPNPLVGAETVVFIFWLAWPIGWRVFVRQYVRRRGLDDPGW